MRCFALLLLAPLSLVSAKLTLDDGLVTVTDTLGSTTYSRRCVPATHSVGATAANTDLLL